MTFNPSEDAFNYFHQHHPEVYAAFCAYVQGRIDYGATFMRVREVTETLRWDRKKPRRILNAHSAYYARLWLKEHPTYPHLFEVRSPVPKRGPRYRDFTEAFVMSHAEHPEIYEKICQRAADMIGRERKRFSMSAIVEWLKSENPGLYIEDHFKPHYARLWLHDHPEHAEFFRTK